MAAAAGKVGRRDGTGQTMSDGREPEPNDAGRHGTPGDTSAAVASLTEPANSVTSTLATPAGVLRRWREGVLGLTPAEAANKAHVSRTQLLNLEAGRRTLQRSFWDQLAESYEGGAGLKGLLAASATSALPVRHLWSHNYDHLPERVWIWVRAAGPHTPAQLSWGRIKLSLNPVPHPDGVIVTAPTSVPNPPAEVHFDPSTGLGWAGFGRGEVPESFGVPLIDGSTALGTQAWTDPSSAVRLQSMLSRHWHQLMELIDYFRLRDGDVIPHLASIVSSDEPAAVEAAADQVTLLPDAEVRLIVPEALRELRRAAGWKETDLAAEIRRAEGADSRVTDDDIHGAETGRRSRHTHLLALIDLTLGLDGRSCLSPVSVSSPARGQVKISFPEFWVGPIYLRLVSKESTHRRRRVTLTWGPWRRRLNVAHGAIVTTRRAARSSPPLLVDVPIGWQVEAGLGWPPGAHDVGEGWTVNGLGGLLRLVNEGLAGARAQRHAEGQKRRT